MHAVANKEVIICSGLRGQLILDIENVNKQTNNMYINKQTAAKAGFNPHSILDSVSVCFLRKETVNPSSQIVSI